MNCTTGIFADRQVRSCAPSKLWDFVAVGVRLQVRICLFSRQKKVEMVKREMLIMDTRQERWDIKSALLACLSVIRLRSCQEVNTEATPNTPLEL